MKIVFLTICLDAMPWLTRHWPEFEKLPFDWQWVISEGVAAPTACTKWCSPMLPRLSSDGTTQYLDSLAAYDSRVILHRKELWQGKLAMVNEPLRYMHEPCLLVQVDSDELWTAEQLVKLRQMFMDNPDKTCAYFNCDYRVGPNVRITSCNGYGNNNAYEWHRAWRWQRGMVFASHEPPVLANFNPKPFTHTETEAAGLVFRHEAYSTEKQVAFKETYYGSLNNPKGHLYRDAVSKWRALQLNVKWPVDLKQYLLWVGDSVVADQIVKPL